MGVSPDQLVEALRARHRASRERDRQRADEVPHMLTEELADLAAEGLVRRAWLIGTLAWGGFGVHSDADVVVEGLKPSDLAAVWERLGRRARICVDLLRFEELTESFRARVEAQGVAIDVS